VIEPLTDLALATGAAGLGLAGVRTAARNGAAHQAFELTLPYGTRPEAVVAFCRSLAGLLPPWWKRWLGSPCVVIEVAADADGITHRLTAPASFAPYVLTQLRAALPGVRIKVHADGPSRAVPVAAAELRLSSLEFPIRSDASRELAAGLLATLQPLRPGESVALQWLLSPAPPPRRPSAAGSLTAQLGFGPGQLQAQLTSPDQAAVREKASEPAVWAVARIGADAADRKRARALVRQVEGAFHAAGASGVTLRRRWLPERVVAGRIVRRSEPALHWPMLLNAKELGAVVGLPVGELTLPGLMLAGTRQLAPSPDIPRRGRVVGRSTYTGAERALALSVADSLRHLHVVGPTGVGKSTLLLNLICSDLAAGRGVIVIDPKGDLVRDVLERVPDGRAGDVVLLDPTDAERPVGFNLFADANGAPELVADQVIAIFRGLFAAFWGPRTDDVMRAAVLTLTRKPGMTLAEVPLLLTDDGFRRRLTADLDDYVLEGFWAWYEALSPGERAQVVGPVLNKVRAFLVRRRLRNVIGQSDSTFSLDEVLSDRKVLLVSLAKGVLGEDAAGLLGAAILARLWQAVQARAALPSSERRPVFCHVDEFQDYLKLPTNLADVLAQARGYGFGLTLAHQHLGQLPSDVRQAVLANARSRIAFQLPADDARTLAREFAPYLAPTDLQGLGPYEAVFAASAGARVTPPVTMATLPPTAATGSGEAARALSRQRYGRPLSEVEAAMRERVNGKPKVTAVGSRRRG
jgi:DNA helicase HerA-like ATPase